MQASFERDGVRFNYFVDDFTDPWSKAPTVLLLHSAMGSARRFYSWVPTLSRHYRVVRMDLRGHGATQIPSPDSELSLQVMADDVLALLDHLDCPQAHVVGNSGGGYVAQYLAIHHPQRVATLALFASSPGAKNTQVTDWMPRLKEKGLRDLLERTIGERFPIELANTAHARHFVDAASSNDLAFIARFLGYMGSQDLSDQLHRITCPTLVVVPGGEQIGTTDIYEPMKQRITRSEMLVYDGAQHSIAEYLAERCVNDLAAFLERHNAR